MSCIVNSLFLFVLCFVSLKPQSGKCYWAIKIRSITSSRQDFFPLLNIKRSDACGNLGYFNKLECSLGTNLHALRVPSTQITLDQSVMCWDDSDRFKRADLHAFLTAKTTLFGSVKPYDSRLLVPVNRRFKRFFSFPGFFSRTRLYTHRLRALPAHGGRILACSMISGNPNSGEMLIELTRFLTRAGHVTNTAPVA